MPEIQAICFYQLGELKLTFEQERSQMLRDFHAEKDMLNSERDQDMDRVKEGLKADLAELEKRTQEERGKDAKVNAWHFLFISSGPVGMVLANERKHYLLSSL